MSKTRALLFSVFAVCLLIAVAAALSFKNLWLALVFMIAYVAAVGFGFVVKARARRKEGGGSNRRP